MDFEEAQPASETLSERRKSKEPTSKSTVKITESRLQAFKSSLNKCMRKVKLKFVNKIFIINAILTFLFLKIYKFIYFVKIITLLLFLFLFCFWEKYSLLSFSRNTV